VPCGERGAVAATVVEVAIGCTASVQSLPPAKSAIKRHEALLEQRRRSTPSNREWTEILPGLDGSTCRCHRCCSGCVSPLALSAAGRLFEVESANECIEMLPPEPRETLLLVWKLAGDRVANPTQVPIGTPLDLIMVAPCLGLSVAGSLN
jgi:hypothetical protein